MISLVKKLKFRHILKLRNKKGDMLIGVAISLIALVLMAALSASGGIDVLGRVTSYSAMSTMTKIAESLELMLIDHPGIAIECGQTYTAATGVYSAITAPVSTKYVEIINQYLDESLKFDPATGLSAKVDPWGNHYELYISTTDLDYNDSTGTTTKITTGSVDSEIRIIIKCLGKNLTIARTTTNVLNADGHVLDDIDDYVAIAQSINGNVKSGTYGFDKNRGVPHFVDDTDTNRVLDELMIV